MAVGALLAWVAGNALALNSASTGLANGLTSTLGVLAVLGLTSLVVIIRCQAKWRVRGGIIALALLAGLAHAHWRTQHLPPNHIHQAIGAINTPVTLTATIIQQQPHPRDAHAQRATLSLHTINAQLVTGNARVWKTTAALPATGQPFTATATLRASHPPNAPGGFNEQRILQSSGIHAVASRLNHIAVLPTPTPTTSAPWWQKIAFHGQQWQQRLSLQFGDFQQSLTHTFYAHLPKKQGDMLAGVVLGSRAAPIDEITRTQFARTGLIHFLAASGLNVGIVAGAVLGLGALLRLPERWALPWAMGAVVAYGFLAGWAPSVVRASSMLLLALGFRWWRQSLTPVMLFCMALALLVTWQPTLLDNLGFQLSLVTTFGILTMVPPLQRHLGHYLTQWGAALILVPIVAQAWVIPLIGSVFHSVAWHSVALNVVAVACVTPLTVIGFTMAFVASVLGWVPLVSTVVGWLGLLAWPFATGLLWLAKVGNKLGEQFSALVWHPPSLPTWWVLGYYGIALLAAWWLNQPSQHPHTWFSRPRQRIAVWVGLLALWGAAYAGWWTLHLNGSDVWVLAGRPQPGSQWALLARQPNQNQYIGWVPGTVNHWQQRQLTQLAQFHGGGTGSNVQLISLQKHPNTTTGPYRMRALQNDYTLTAKDTCLFSATPTYNHTHQCAVVWWARPNRPGKLWQNPHLQSGVLKNANPPELHPNWVHIRW